MEFSQTKDYKELEKAFIQDFKERGISLTVSFTKNMFIVSMLENNQKVTLVAIKNVKKLPSWEILKSSRFFLDVLPFIKQIAEMAKIEYLFGKLVYEDSKHLIESGFKRIRFEKFVYFEPAYAPTNRMYFDKNQANVFILPFSTEGLIRHQNLILAADSFAAEYTKGNPSTTFSLEQPVAYPNFSLGIYHMGFTGYILFVYDKETYRIELFEKKTKYGDEKLIKNDFQSMTNLNDFSNVINCVLRECENIQKFTNLFSPPRSHFNRYFENHFNKCPSPFIDYIHDYLIGHMDAMEIENEVLTASHRVVPFETKGAMYLEFLGFHFTLLWETEKSEGGKVRYTIKEMNGFPNQHQAYMDFQEKIDKYEKQRYQERQVYIERVLKKVKIN